MQRKLGYIALILMLFLSCEEIYKPELEIVPGTLVVESRVTNDHNQNFVRLSKTNDFYNTEAQEKVTGARVDLVQVTGTNLRPIETPITSTENSPGFYEFQNLPVSGMKYKLRIRIGQDIFESNLELMPPLPVIDSLYTGFELERSYRTDSYGPPTLVESPGQEIYIDAPITPSIQYYRFKWRTVLQWTYYPGSSFGPPPPSYFGWISRYQDGLFNLAGIKQFSSSNHISKHPILTLPYDVAALLDSTSQLGCGWIVMLDQYGISKDSYAYFENLNKQLTAEGNLFDPLLAQVYGNIRCKNDASKIALGNFNLNSYRHYRYYLNLGFSEKNKVIKHEIKNYPEIPDRGYVRGIPPVFWEIN
jgi:hypothetical protein